MLSNEAGWFDREENSVGCLTSKLAADATLVRTSLVDRLSTIVQNTALIVAAFVVAFKLSWRIAAVTVAMFPLLIGASIAEVKRYDFPNSHQTQYVQNFACFQPKLKHLLSMLDG